MSTYIHCFANPPISAGIPTALLDVSALTAIVLPAGCFIKNVYFQNNSFTATTGVPPLTVPAVATFSIGWSSSPGAVVPTTALITSAGLNTNDIMYIPTGTHIADASSQSLMLTSSADISAGIVNVILETTTYTSLP